MGVCMFEEEKLCLFNNRQRLQYQNQKDDMKQKIQLQNIDSQEPVSTIPTTPQSCFSRQIFIELERNEKLKLQLLKAQQTIQQLKSQSIQQKTTFPFSHDISFKDVNGINEPEVEAILWKGNYENLMKYISKHMESAEFLVEKYEKLRQQCKDYKQKTLELKKKEKKWSEQEANLIQKLEETIRSAEDMINNLTKVNFQQNKKIYSLEKQVQNLQIQLRNDNRIYAQELQRREGKIIEQKYKIDKQEKDIQMFRKEMEILRKQMKGKEQSHELSINKLLSQQKNELLEKDKYCMKLQRIKEQTLILCEKMRKEKQNLQFNNEEDRKTYENVINSLHEKTQLQERQFKREIDKLVSIKNDIQIENKQIKFDQFNNSNELAKVQSIIADLELRLNQKERQIEELKHIKEIEEKKYFELESKNGQLLSDIQTIIEQLKIRQLQVQKLQKEKSSQTYLLDLNLLERQNESQVQLLFEGSKGCESVENIEVEEKVTRQPKFSLQAFQKKIEKESKRKFYSNRKIR